jgi:hypothetical protein
MSQAAKKIEPVEEIAPMMVVRNEEPVVEIPAPAPKPELTLEQKINKVEDLSTVIEKWRKLIESRRNLQSFKLANDGMSNHLRLVDQVTGMEFKTHNTAVIETVLNVIRQTLDAKISDVEDQIRF